MTECKMCTIVQVIKFSQEDASVNDMDYSTSFYIHKNKYGKLMHTYMFLFPHRTYSKTFMCGKNAPWRFLLLFATLMFQIVKLSSCFKQDNLKKYKIFFLIYKQKKRFPNQQSPFWEFTCPFFWPIKYLSQTWSWPEL